MKKSIVLFGTILTLFSFSCKKADAENIAQPDKVSKKLVSRKAPRTAVTYTFENTKEWLKTNKDSGNLEIAFAVNRTDKAFFIKMDSVIIPKDRSGDISFYLPFPVEVPYLANVDKILFFSYPTQTFAAYENGTLMRTGPTNMGRKEDPTPTGLFFTNWKAEETISTFDDEWKLLWNFNIDNKKGVGFHQYNLPGYPASHSCLRLLEKDAKYLYEWADQWVLIDDNNVKLKGTPVIVFGSYPFGTPKPWLQLVKNPRALNISVNEMEKTTTPYLASILKEQEKRNKS